MLEEDVVVMEKSRDEETVEGWSDDKVNNRGRDDT